MKMFSVETGDDHTPLNVLKTTDCVLCMGALCGVGLYLNEALHIHTVYRIREFLVRFQLQDNVQMDKLDMHLEKAQHSLWHRADALYVHTVTICPASQLCRAWPPPPSSPFCHFSPLLRAVFFTSRLPPTLTRSIRSYSLLHSP